MPDGKTLLSRRKELNLSREDVASRLGVSANTIRNWETGAIEPAPKVTELHKCCEAYQCSLTEFIELVEGTKKEHEQH